MGNPCVCFTGASSSKDVSTSRLHTANLSDDLREPSKFKRVKLQKQQKFFFQKSGTKAVNQSRRRTPNTLLVHCSYLEHTGPLVDHGKQSIPLISSLATHIVNRSETILNHITAQIKQGTLQAWMDQILHGLPTAFDDSFQIASSSPAISAATIFMALTGSAIALQSSKSNFPLSLSKLNTLKDRILKLQIKWSTSAKEHSQREKSQSDEDAEDSLPLQYDTEAISDYYKKRPFLVFSRASFILLECSILLVNILMDNALGKAQQNERLRASQLVNLITLFGPTAVKVTSI